MPCGIPSGRPRGSRTEPKTSRAYGAIPFVSIGMQYRKKRKKKIIIISLYQKYHDKSNSRRKSGRGGEKAGAGAGGRIGRVFHSLAWAVENTSQGTASALLRFDKWQTC